MELLGQKVREKVSQKYKQNLNSKHPRDDDIFYFKGVAAPKPPEWHDKHAESNSFCTSVDV